MNPRIRALAEQAGYQEDMFGIGHWDMIECKKFVEMIVQECSRIADGWVDNDDNGKNYPSEIIKQYFGIKE